jgi:hypothetical protein
VSRISDIMQETYALTRLDYLHCRSWTRGCSEFDVTTDVIDFTMRDVGGDELNREQHWGAAIKDSFCIMFVVSLSDYTHMQKKGHTTAKFRHIRKMLWSYLTDKVDPKIILILNKQDLFREMLKDVPLHKGCKEFESFAPQAEGEPFEAYCKRCEETTMKYFQKIPSSIKECERVKKREESDPAYSAKKVRLCGVFVTQATDASLFGEVRKDIFQICYACYRNEIQNCGLG